MDFQLTQKERMLLEDQKNHEQICIEKYKNYANQTSCPQLKQIFNANCQGEQEHLNTINQLLNGTIPQMNQQSQQNQGQSQNQGMQQQSQAGTSNTQQSTAVKTDKDMCTDMLMTEKYVSGTYDTTIFEFQDPRVRDVLNHIQKEEQKHGEAIFQYMKSQGMYQPQ
ncbi:MAG TPA: spore coat protein [Candidatus Avimonas sp.]|nr:spore coat protein [Clostridiales bacterium]HPU58152.1 spore coat protein [Candidatus Avimonas sp.]